MLVDAIPHHSLEAITVNTFEIVLYNASGLVIDRTEFSNRDKALAYARELLNDYPGHSAVLVYVRSTQEAA